MGLVHGCRATGSDLSADGPQRGDRRGKTGWDRRGYLSRRSGAGRPGAGPRARRGGADPGSGAAGRNAQVPVGSARTDANISVGRYSSTAASTGGGLKNSDPAPANPSSVAHARPAADVSAPTAGLP